MINSILPSLMRHDRECGRGWKGSKPPGCWRGKNPPKRLAGKGEPKGKRKAAFSKPLAKPKNKPAQVEKGFKTALASAKLRSRVKPTSPQKSQPIPEKQSVAKQKPKGPTLAGADKLTKPARESKLPKIKTDKDFKKYLLGHAASLGADFHLGDQIPLKRLFDRMASQGVSKSDFEEKIYKLHSTSDDFRLASLGSLADLGHRHAIKSKDLQDKAAKAWHISMGPSKLKRNTLVITNSDAFSRVPEVSKWETSKRGIKTGEVINTQSGFNKAAESILATTRKKHSNLTPIYELRDKIGDRVTREQFDKSLIALQRSGKVQTTGGSLNQQVRDRLEDAVSTPGSGSRFYVRVND